ncbi:MAG: ABC-2 family transporter protein [Cyanobacteria bacterium SZAS-4]|nr:ABC-2 family transporter protein [Cyanobacteria bacterium SZAS-4]
MRTLVNYLKLAAAYTRLNLDAQLEYRGAFYSQVVAMFINNCIWVWFWVLFFGRFKVLRGWDINDVVTLWCIAASGFGLAHTVCGNALQLAVLIARGQLDVWMLYPRALLPHILLGRMSATAWGDAIFGYIVYLIFVKPDLPHFALFVALTVSIAFLFVGFSIFTGSLTFFLGNSESLAEQWRYAMITFSTYPATLFEGAVKILLYTLIPAVFVSYYPIIALRQLSLSHALIAVAGSAAVVAAGVFVFYYGLRRYESGNLMEMRG